MAVDLHERMNRVAAIDAYLHSFVQGYKPTASCLHHNIQNWRKIAAAAVTCAEMRYAEGKARLIEGHIQDLIDIGAFQHF